MIIFPFLRRLASFDGGNDVVSGCERRKSGKSFAAAAASRRNGNGTSSACVSQLQSNRRLPFHRLFLNETGDQILTKGSKTKAKARNKEWIGRGTARAQAD